MSEQYQPQRLAKTGRRKKNKIALLIVLLGVLLLAAAVVLAVIVLRGDSAGSDPAVQQQEGVVTIAAVGDIHMDPTLMQAARTASNDYDFSPSFLGVADHLVGADITVGNLECSFAGPDAVDKEGWAPDSMAGTLSGLGFDILQTANSYAITGGMEGLNRSVQVIEGAQMQTVGTSLSKKDYRDDHGIAEVEVNGMRVVFVAFTKGLNNMSLPEGNDYAVNLLYEDYDTNYSELAEDEIRDVMQAAQKRNPDVLIALVHWGVEGDDEHSEVQEEVADILIEEGADAIIGSHSHMVGGFETRTVITEDDEERSGFVAYDLGDFYTASDKNGSNQSLLLQLKFTRDRRGNTELSSISYVPLYRTDDAEGAGMRFQVWDARLAMELYEQGYVQRVSREEYDAMAAAVEDITEIVAAPEEPELPPEE